MNYQNPVITGFSADPSICRKGDDFYLVCSSFEYFPGVPIYHSKNLADWTQLGHCLDRDKQLPIQGAVSSQGVFAPTIRYHNGIFYMITTNVTNYYNFYVTAEDPSGPWSDPIIVENWTGIDPSLFFDEDGRAYITGNSYKIKGEELGCYMAEIDIATGRLLSPRTLISHGCGGKAPEAPHIYKREGWYYLVLAEGGTEYGHMATIFRSRQVTGPYESCPANPVLTHRSKKSPIQGVGHMDMIEDQNGNWWAVCLGMRVNGSHAYYHHLGRETFLAPVKWQEDGWPVIGNQGMISLEMDANLPGERTKKCRELNLSFKEGIPKEWNYLRNPVRENYILQENEVTLKGCQYTLDDCNHVTFLGRKQTEFHCEFQAELSFDPNGENEEAGLCVYMRDHYHYDVSIYKKNGHKYLRLRKRIGSIDCISYETIMEQESITIGIEADEKFYKFYYLADDEKHRIGEGECAFLASELSATFTGVYLGLFATGNGRDSQSLAHFHNIVYRKL